MVCRRVHRYAGALAAVDLHRCRGICDRSESGFPRHDTLQRGARGRGCRASVGRAARSGDRNSLQMATPSGLSDHPVLRPLRLCPLDGLWPKRGSVEKTTRGRTCRSSRHHRSRASRSTACFGPARGRARAPGIRDRRRIGAAAWPGLRDPSPGDETDDSPKAKATSRPTRPV